MEEIQFKVGDVVVLKSGSVTMTIESFTWDELRDTYRNDKVECTWMNVKNEIQRDSFFTLMLEHN